MLDFYDLGFEARGSVMMGQQAKMFFDNGYGVSVVLGSNFYSNGRDTYELAVLSGDADSWTITYDTPVTNDVLGHLSSLEVTNAMLAVQALHPLMLD